MPTRLPRRQATHDKHVQTSICVNYHEIEANTVVQKDVLMPEEHTITLCRTFELQYATAGVEEQKLPCIYLPRRQTTHDKHVETRKCVTGREFQAYTLVEKGVPMSEYKTITLGRSMKGHMYVRHRLTVMYSSASNMLMTRRENAAKRGVVVVRCSCGG